MKNIKICDVSLSLVGNSNVALSFKEKLEIAKKLDDLNIDVLEIKDFGEKADEVLIKTLATCLTKTTIGYVCDFNEESIVKGNALLSNAKRKKIIIKLPVSTVGMEYSFSVKPKVVIENLKALLQKATSLCDNVEVCFDDATRAESEFLYSAINIAIENKAKSISIIDKLGALESNEFKNFIDDIYKNIPSLKDIEVYVECADVFNMATASMLASFDSGVCGVKLSALNNCKLANFETFFNALDFIGSKKGYSSKINKTCISRVVSQISSLVSSTKQTTITETKVDTEDLAKKYTISELTKLLKSRGYDLNNDDIKKVLDEINRISERKNLTTKDLDSIVAVTALQVPSTYSLVSYAVHCSNVLNSTANVSLKEHDDIINGIAIGNGSIDSAFLAIENALCRHFDLDEFVVNGVTEGKEAMGETIIKLRFNGKIYSGRGVSTDIVGASIRAYINAVNKIVYEERE